MLKDITSISSKAQLVLGILAFAGWLRCCPDVQFGGADSCAKPPPLLYGSPHQLAHAAPLQRARRPVEKSDHSGKLRSNLVGPCSDSSRLMRRSAGAFIEGSRPQRCLRRELVDSAVIHSNLQQGNALFKNLCSKFSTTRSKDSA